MVNNNSVKVELFKFRTTLDEYDAFLFRCELIIIKESGIMNKNIYISLICAGLAVLSGCGDSGSNSTQVNSDSTAYVGKVSFLNGAENSNEIIAKIRSTSDQATVSSNGDFTITADSSTVERNVIIDISGPGIMTQQIPVNVPANSKFVSVDASVTARGESKSFNLEQGATIESDNGTTVTLPPSAFEFDDGTPASGEALASITEIDVNDLEGSGAFAPPLVGLSDNGQETAIYTFGMADFHFTQGGQDLQLKDGVEAIIAMDLPSPYMMTDTLGAVPVEAVAGAEMPLWHYDTEQMVWKEEGSVEIQTDAGSDSGFSASGSVSHFSTWNIDYATPVINAKVIVRFVDEQGVPIDGFLPDSYTTRVRIPPSVGAGWHNSTSWSNTKQMTQSNNDITVLGNEAGRQNLIDNNTWITGFTTMDIKITNVIVNDVIVNSELPEKNETFYNYQGDNIVYFDVTYNPV